VADDDQHALDRADQLMALERAHPQMLAKCGSTRGSSRTHGHRIGARNEREIDRLGPGPAYCPTV
jgi:hypothetical protein